MNLSIVDTYILPFFFFFFNAVQSIQMKCVLASTEFFSLFHFMHSKYAYGMVSVCPCSRFRIYIQLRRGECFHVVSIMINNLFCAMTFMSLASRMLALFILSFGCVSVFVCCRQLLRYYCSFICTENIRLMMTPAFPCSCGISSSFMSIYERISFCVTVTIPSARWNDRESEWKPETNESHTSSLLCFSQDHPSLMIDWHDLISTTTEMSIESKSVNWN